MTSIIKTTIRPGERLLSVTDSERTDVTALYSGVLHRLAVDGFKRTAKAARSDDAVTAIVFAAASSEAFINELREMAEVYGRMGNDEALKTLSVVLQDAEESRLSITTKYVLAKRFLTGATYDRGGQLFQDFSLLVELRNVLMHTRPRELNNLSSRDQKLLERLVSRGLIEKNYSQNFLDNLANPNVARFSCNAAAAIICDLDRCYKWPQCENVGMLISVKEPPRVGTTPVEHLFQVLDT